MGSQLRFWNSGGMAWLALVVTTACSDPALVQPPSVTVQIEGSRNVALLPSGQRTLQATVSGSPVQRVIWRSTNPAIATIDTTGLVIARDTGTAWAVATAAIDAQSRDSVSLDVGYWGVEVPPASVTIVSILKQGTSTDVDRSAVTGTIVVSSSWDWPPTALPVLRVRLNDQTVCQTQLESRRGTVPCVINTTLSANGPATLRVELVQQTSVIFAVATAPLVLAN